MAMTTLHHNIVVLDWLDFLQNVAIEPTSDYHSRSADKGDMEFRL